MAALQLHQMRHLREKVRVLRTDTERNLVAVTAAAEEARARRALGGDPLASLSPRAVGASDSARFQVCFCRLRGFRVQVDWWTQSTCAQAP